jgi:hypothetical protein
MRRECRIPSLIAPAHSKCSVTPTLHSGIVSVASEDDGSTALITPIMKVSSARVEFVDSGPDLDETNSYFDLDTVRTPMYGPLR